jgi:hypothetical protein
MFLIILINKYYKKMNYYIKLFCSVIVLLIITTSCSEQNIDNTDLYQVHPTTDNIEYNPYEWVGQAHNNILHYVQQNYTLPIYSGNWQDAYFHNEVFGYVDSAIYVLYPNFVNVDSLGDIRYWYNQLDDLETLLTNYSNVITSNNKINLLDKQYSLAVLQLANELLNGTTIISLDTGLARITALESTLIAQKNNITNDNGISLSLYSISYLKNSYLLWIDKYPENENDTPQTKAVNRTRVGVNAVVDYTVGAATFASATGATGGVGAAAGLYAGIKAGAAASMAADWVGGLLGWW